MLSRRSAYCGLVTGTRKMIHCRSTRWVRAPCEVILVESLFHKEVRPCSIKSLNVQMPFGANLPLPAPGRSNGLCSLTVLTVCTCKEWPMATGVPWSKTISILYYGDSPEMS
jgi:hypothetical protein